MIVLYATICLMSDDGSNYSTPQQCREIQLNFEGDASKVTVQQCNLYGQMELANWVVKQPQKWWIQKWKCGEGGLSREF